MASSENAPIDIEILMERIRAEVSRRNSMKGSQPAPAASQEYVLGTVLRFGTDGNAGPYLGTGWSDAETDFRWTDGEAAELFFTFGKPPGDLALSFKANPLIGSGVEAQEVSAFWNGLLVGEWSIRQNRQYHTLVLAPLTANITAFRLKFQMPLSFSPLSKGLSSDPRRLGLAIHELILRPARELGFQ